jgi:hypothetical protein
MFTEIDEKYEEGDVLKRRKVTTIKEEYQSDGSKHKNTTIEEHEF